jgi:hypothetical protein
VTMLDQPAPQAQSLRSGTSEGGAQCWWWSLSTVALVCALGLMLISLAFWAGRSGHDGSAATAAYWLGQLLIAAPIAGRLLSRQTPSHGQSLGLVALLVGAEYAVKFCYSPIMFTFPDELEHWRSTENILQTGHLFTVNYSLPISPDYPGLENVTAALSSITGLSVFASGFVVIGAAHLLLVALLYALFHKLSGSTRVSGIGCLIYAMNPHFGFFDSMFIYQAMALPFLVLALYAVLQLTPPSGSREAHLRTGWWVVLVLSLATTTVSHHVTSYVLAALLALLAAVTAVRSGSRAARVPALAFGLAVAAIAGWLLFAARSTLSYLAPAIASLTGGLARNPTGQNPTQPLPAGPIGDRVLVLILVLALAVLLLYGALRIWRGGRRGIGPITFLVASLSYYYVLVVRLVSPDGAELAGRAFTFVFIPVAYVVAVGVVVLIQQLKRSPLRARAGELIVVGLAVAMFAGGIAGAWPPYWERLPGAYQVGGFERSVSPQGIAAANWALTALGPGNRFGVDTGNAALLAAYGRQDTLRNASSLYYSDHLGPTQRAYLATSALRYLFVDRRLAQSPPVGGSYFQVDPYAGQITRPIPLQDLDKYDAMAGVDRPYDSGDIVIYDLRGLSGAQ